MNQSINTDSKNSKEPQQKYRLGTVSIKILGGLNRFYRRLTSPSASMMAQNIQLFGPLCLFEQLSYFCDIDLLCILGTGDIRIELSHMDKKLHSVNKYLL